MASPSYVIVQTVRAETVELMTNSVLATVKHFDPISIDLDKAKDMKLSQLIDLADLMGGNLSIHLVKND